MANDWRNGVVHITSQLNYAKITLSSDWKKILSKKQNNFVILLFIFISNEVTTANPFVSKAKVKASCKFATSPDILGDIASSCRNV